MNSLSVRVFADDSYQSMGGHVFEWRATLDGEEYGCAIHAGVSMSFDAIGIAYCVRQMNKSIEKIVFGETHEERELKRNQFLLEHLEKWRKDDSPDPG